MFYSGSHVVMYPNFNNNGNGYLPSGSGYPFPQQQQLQPEVEWALHVQSRLQPAAVEWVPLLPAAPVVTLPVVPPAFVDQYTGVNWNPWHEFGPVNPTGAWRHQAAAAARPTPYDRPVTLQHQVPYGGRPHVPTELFGAHGIGAPSEHILGPHADVMRALPVPFIPNQQSAFDTFHNNLSPDMDFDVHVSSTKLEVHWKAPRVSGRLTYELEVAEGRSIPFSLLFPAEQTKHTIRAKAGESYVISLTARRAPHSVIVAQGRRRVKAIFSASELRQLHDKAAAYTGIDLRTIEVLYRCKPRAYWDDIHHNRHDHMQKYMKDDNGQPGNMINGVISGLFFMGRLFNNSGDLPDSSPFGDVRMLVPTELLLDPETVNLYFADFYCYKQVVHYVTVVVAKKGSDSDNYARTCLIQLNAWDNPWLRCMVAWDEQGPTKPCFAIANRENLWVEVFYTESIPLGWGRFDEVTPKGAGTSTIGGLANNKSCLTCNLYPPAWTAPVGAAATVVDAADAASAAGAASPVAAKAAAAAPTAASAADAVSPAAATAAAAAAASEAATVQRREKDEQGEKAFAPLTDEAVKAEGVVVVAVEEKEKEPDPAPLTLPSCEEVDACPERKAAIECLRAVVDTVIREEEQARKEEITVVTAQCEEPQTPCESSAAAEIPMDPGAHDKDESQPQPIPVLLAAGCSSSGSWPGVDDVIIPPTVLLLSTPPPTPAEYEPVVPVKKARSKTTLARLLKPQRPNWKTTVTPVKEEEPTVSSSPTPTTVVPMEIAEPTVSLDQIQNTVEDKKEEASVVDSVMCEDAKSTVAAESIDGEDEYLAPESIQGEDEYLTEDEGTVDQSMTDSFEPTKDVIFGLSEEDERMLLMDSGHCSLIDITPEMEDELLRND